MAIVGDTGQKMLALYEQDVASSAMHASSCKKSLGEAMAVIEEMIKDGLLVEGSAVWCFSVDELTKLESPTCVDMSRSSSRDQRRICRRRAVALHVMLQNHAAVMAAYYYKFLYKVPCYTSPFTSHQWLHEIMTAQNGIRCINAFQMEKSVLIRLCGELEANYGLRPSSTTSVLEKVTIFLYTMALGISNRDVCERFQRSGWIVSHAIHDVLEAIVDQKSGFRGLARDIIRPSDPQFARLHEKLTDNRYKHFKVID